MILIGYIGSFLLSITFIPQLVHLYNIKDSSGISKIFVGINIIGTMCMLTYGIHDKLLPIILSNSVILFLSTVLSVMIIIYRKNG